MAYMSQERKAQIAPVIKKICKKYGVKASLAVRHHSTLVLNIKQGDIDFINNFLDTVGRNEENLKWVGEKCNIDVNTYWYKDQFTGKALKFLNEIIPAMNIGNHNNSDVQTDYFDVGWYIDVNIGKWNQPYALVK
jgi:hypothetical protein